MLLCIQVLHFHCTSANPIPSITFSLMFPQFSVFHALTLTSTSCSLSLWDLTWCSLCWLSSFPTYIMAAILKMSSAAGKKKAFTTCASHLIAVFSSCTTYHTCTYSLRLTIPRRIWKWPLFYGIVIPILNPLVYSLRNKEVKEAPKVMKKKFF